MRYHIRYTGYVKNTASWETTKKKLLKDPGVKKEYERLAPIYDLIAQILEERYKFGLTQKELAKRMGTTQSAIARFESGNYNPSFEFMQKLAGALHKKLEISIK